MVSPQLTDFLTSLNHSEFISDLASVCQASLSSHPQVEYVDEEVGRVANILYESVLVSQQQDGIGSQVLRRVVNKFRTSVDTQSLQMQILDVLLLKARTDYGVKTADVPVIVQLRRDRPILRPDSLLLGNAASRLRQLLTDEQQRPSALEGDTEAILGRLLLHLFFMERVESLEQALFLAKSAPRLTYLDGLVFIEANFKDELCRYALSEAGVLWWLHWLRLKAEGRIGVLNKRPAVYVASFLARMPQWFAEAPSLSKLKLLRKIDYSLRFSPIHFAFLTGYSESRLLPAEVLMRLITGLRVGRLPDETVEPTTQLTTREFRHWRQQAGQDRYAMIREQEVELRALLEPLRPVSGRARNGKLIESRHALHVRFEGWLEDNKQKFSPYLWLLVAWTKSLLLHGGVAKSHLKPGTILDYVMTIAPGLLAIFSPYRIDQLTGEDWVELLNQLTQDIKSPQRKGFVVYLAMFLRDSGLVPDLTVGDLEIQASQGQVDANLVPLQQIERLWTLLATRTDELARDAALLMCLCYYSGLRRNEAAFLQLADIELGPNREHLGPINLLVRHNVRRSLKSPSATRVLPLDVLWPSQALSRLKERVLYRRESGGAPTDMLFENQERTERAFRYLAWCLQQLTGDAQLRIHHLRHSFANWQWFRLNPRLLTLARQEISLFAHDYFSVEAVARFHKRLGVQPYSRKSMFLLCHLLGHAEPATTIGSYLHLKDLTGYLLLGAGRPVSHKLVTYALGRGKVIPRQESHESLALRLQFEVRTLENQIAPLPYGRELSVCAPISGKSLNQWAAVKQDDQEEQSQHDILFWARILMACADQPPERIAVNEGIRIQSVERLLDIASQIRNQCPRRGRHRLNLVPALGPWIRSMVRHPQSVSERTCAPPKPAAHSHSQNILTYLLGKLQTALEQGQLDWDEIKEACRILYYLVPGQGFLLRVPDVRQADKFFALCRKLGMGPQHFALTLHVYPSPAPHKVQGCTEKWKKMLASQGMEAQCQLGQAGEWTYIRKKWRDYGVLDIGMVNRRLKPKARRQRVFISVVQLITILAIFHRPEKKRKAAV